MKLKSVLSLICGMGVIYAQAADVREGMVSYWPLDTISSDLMATPDLVSGNHMNVVNVYDNSVLVTGKRGKAFEFDGDKPPPKTPLRREEQAASR